MKSLGQRAIHSVKWTSLQTFITGVSGGLLLLVKARFLSPEEFGYLAILFIVTGLISLLENFGISQAIIQKDEISTQESSSLLYFNLLSGVLLALMLFITAPFIARVFSLPLLEKYLRMSSIIAVLISPSLLFRAFLEKYMHFKYLSIINIISALIGLGLTTILLSFGLGVFGVIYANIVGAFFSTTMILSICFRLKFIRISIYFNPMYLLPFLRFGFFVSAKQLATFLTHRLDEVVIGYFLSADILGIYHFGKNMLEKIRELMTNSFSKVLFAVLSKLKYKPQKLTMAYQRITRYVAFVAFPLFTGIALTAHLFVPLLFGEQWIESIIVFQVFSISLVFLALTANISTSLLYSVNKPDVVFYIDVFTNILYFSSLFVFASQGMLSVLIAYAFYVIYKTVILQYFVNRQLQGNFIDYLRQLAIPAGSTIVMLFIVFIFLFVSKQIIGIPLQLTGALIIGCLIYGLMLWFFAKTTLNELRLLATKGELTY